uniref:ATP-binding cassette, sub-family E (OABP), member 1 n=1 Tax=Labrus bergylta TaxID=56723 RepID=A0A3Q3FZC9_9LABR
MADKNTRIAIVNHDKCKPKKCRQECKKSCPVVRMGKLCIEVTPQSKIVWISESLCIGCGICIKKCPFGALSIVNLPSNLEKETTHRYCANSFKLHRLPIPRPGEVLGLVGTNGIGKSTALKILAGKQKPNLGKFDNPPDWQEILTYFRGSELQNYFTKILEDDLRAIVKPQYVDQIPKTVKGSVGAILGRKDDTDTQDLVCRQLDLSHLRERNVEDLSGGELQRFACAVVCIQRADIFMFDEPSSYLDVKQRLKAAITIRSLITPDRYIIVVEHDLSVLDYLSDFICCLYGVPSAYGVVTMPFSVREGINIFLDGYVPTENLRFRETSLVFKVAETANEEEVKRLRHYQYPNMGKTLGEFTLDIKEGEFSDSEIMVMLGENGTGKTTFIRMLAGALKSDDGGESHTHTHCLTDTHTLTHTHTVSHTHTHTHTHSHTHTLTDTHTLTHTVTHSHTHTHTHTHCHTHTLTLSHSHSLTHTHTLTHTLSQTHTHTHSHSLTQSHSHTHTHTLTHTVTHSHTHTHCHTHTHTHSHTHSHRHTHTVTHSHTVTHTHTHTQSHTHTLSQTHTLTHSLTHSLTHTVTHSHTHTHTLSHTHTHTLTHTHTHSHTHCHSLSHTQSHTVTLTHTHSYLCCVSGEVPLLCVSYKPQTISPKFKVGSAFNPSIV